MRAWEIQRFGLDGLVSVERPDQPPGPGQALVRIAAVSLNYRDWMTVRGDYNPKQRLPLIPCSDAAGIVAAVGPDVTRVKPGDRVMTLFAQTWLAGPPTYEGRQGALGGPREGVLSEYALLSAEGLALTPDHLSDEEASTLPCAALTAWHALIEVGHIGAADTVLLQGTGGVSIFGLQFARMAGARVIITSSSDDKLARARELGAWQTINYVRTADWDQSARAFTDKRGVDHVLEIGGAETLGRSLKAVRIGGTISVIGVVSGRTAEILLSPVYMQALRVQGVFVGNREMFERMTRAIAYHRMRPIVGRTFPFDAAPDAFSYLAGGKHFGKVCISV